MKLIKISIFEATDGEVVSGTITKQRKRGDAWIVEDIASYVTSDGVERVLLLEDDQRIVVDGTSNRQIVYDHAQAAARPVLSPRSRPITAAPQDADESPAVAAHELAQTGSGFLAALAQERRDRLITEARQLLKKSKSEQPEQPREPVKEG